MRFWGTSAGGPTPSPFCKCRVCENARVVGGKEVRFRSAFRIDKKIMIDIGADFTSQSVRLQDDLTEIEHILFTHIHDDHFNYKMFQLRTFSCAMPPSTKLHVYLSTYAYKGLKSFIDSTPSLIKEDAGYLDEDKVEFVEMEFGNTYKIDDIEVTPLRGMHNTYYEKNSSNYLIRLKDGRLMYYALDSGYYLEETFEFLKKVKLDILISECTFPNERPRDTKGCPVHMDITSCIDTLDRLYENGTIDSTTDIYLTHIGEKGKTHKELETYFNNIDRDYNVNIAYDGLSIDE